MTKKIAIIGAGMSGLACAHHCKKNGFDVTIFEKSRSFAGRISTRRTDYGSFDHGAQYMSVRDKDFAAYILSATENNAVMSWRASGFDGDIPPMIGVPAMKDCVRPLLDGLTIHYEHKILSIHHNDKTLTLKAECHRRDEKDFGGFDHCVVSAPAPQAFELLHVHDDNFQPLQDVRYAPCLTLMVVFDQKLDCADSLRPENSSIGWLAYNSSKPGRSEEAQNYHCYVVQWTKAASEKHINESPEDLIPVMIKSLNDLLPNVSEPVHANVHRWLYSLVEQAVGQDFILSKDGMLSVCGDGLLGPRIELAFLSGNRLAQHLCAKMQD